MTNLFSRDFLIFETLAGSRLYGTANEFSDEDFRGVFIHPVRQLLYPFGTYDEHVVLNDEEDVTYYSLRKFMKLAQDGNPNVIELLFADNRWPDRRWDILYREKDLFLSKRARGTFLGYANQQMGRIDRHLKWVQNPPRKPVRKEYGLPVGDSVINQTHLDAIVHLPTEYFSDGWRELIVAELAYRQDKKSWDKYQMWLRGRNPKRAELEKKVGYDTKHAAHLIRLYFEGTELAQKHYITFPRPEAIQLKNILNCEWPLDTILKVAGDLEAEFIKAMDESFLPDSVDTSKLEELYFKLIGI